MMKDLVSRSQTTIRRRAFIACSITLGTGAYTASDKRPEPNSGLAKRDCRKDCAKQGLRNRVVLVLKSSYWYAVEQ